MHSRLRWEQRRPVRDEFGTILDPGEVLSKGVNEIDLVPNDGLNWISAAEAGTRSGLQVFIAVGTRSATIGMGSSVIGEITGVGLTRTSGVTSGVGALVGLPSGGMTTQGTGSWAIGITFTSSGTITVNEAALGVTTGASANYPEGNTVIDLLSPSATMAAGDTLRIQFEIVL